MGSALSSAQLAAWQSKLAALLLPDTVAVQTATEHRTGTGVTYTYATDTGRDAVACRIDPAQTVERVVNGLTVTQTEWPIWFAVGTQPARTKALLAADGTRYQVTQVAPVTTWTELVEVRAARVGS